MEQYLIILLELEYLFMPSGIGYFENTSAGIPEYSPLIFSVN